MGNIVPSGLGRIFQNILKKASGTYGTVLQISSTLSGIKFGTANEIYQDASGHLNIVNPTTGKNIYVNAKDSLLLILNSSPSIGLYGSLISVLNHMRVSNNKELRLANNDNTKYGYIKNAGGAGVEGPIDFYDSQTTPIKVASLGSNSLETHKQFILNTVGGHKLTRYFISENLIIPIGQGSLGVNTTNFIPAGAIIHHIDWHVILAPGGGATVWEACRIGSANQEIADAGTLIAVNTKGNSVLNADGNMPINSVQVAATGVTVTTDADVTVSDMIIRFILVYDIIGEPTDV